MRISQIFLDFWLSFSELNMYNSWFVWKLLTWLSLRLISIIGESPKYMHSISNVDERFSKDRSNTLYKMDDVVQLQCVGEVENVNSSPTKVNTFFVHTTFKLFFSRKNAACLLIKMKKKKFFQLYSKWRFEFYSF